MQNSHAAQFQTITSIQAAIDLYIADEFEATNKYDLKLSNIDQRLKLPLCKQPLQIFAQTGSLKTGRNSIGVRCTSEKKWTIYTSAEIKSYKKVLVLAQPIQRGGIITEKHLTYKNRNIGDLHQSYFLNSKLVINKQAKRNLSAGIVISDNHFTEPKLITRGEKVNIHAASPYFHISMAGIAMMDGIKGQNIRVRNINSKRIIQATVVRQGQVSVY